MHIALSQSSFMYLCQLSAICEATEVSSMPFAQAVEIGIKEFKQQFGRVPIATFSKKPSAVEPASPAKSNDITISMLQPQAVPNSVYSSQIGPINDEADQAEKVKIDVKLSDQQLRQIQ